MKQTSSLKPLYLPTYPGCIVCGQKAVNPFSLNLRFQVTKDGVMTPFTPQVEQEGYRGIVHGGIITAVLDETIGWAVAVDRKKYFVTGELTVRFLKPLSVGKNVFVRGWSVEHKVRYSVAEGEIIDQEGMVYARASGKFFLLTDQQGREVDSYLSYEENDLQLLS